MKPILLFLLSLSTVVAIAQTQDIYLHNGDNEWNQKRLDAQRRLDYLRQLNESQTAQIENNKSEIKDCANQVREAYHLTPAFREVKDGDHHVWATDNNFLCHDADVKVLNGRIVQLGMGNARIVFSSEISNQYAKINVDAGKFTTWIEVYFIYESTPQQAQTQENAPIKTKVWSDAPLRSTPDINGVQTYTCKTSDDIYIIGCTECDYCKVSVNGLIGYVSKSFLNH